MWLGSCQTVELADWKAITASEIEELSHQLGISPPQSLDEKLFPSDITVSCVNSGRGESPGNGEAGRVETVMSDSVGGATSAVVVNNRDIDRETLVEYLDMVREEGKLINLRNNYFHEYLVEHFKRKQMMHVYRCTAEDEDEDEAEEDVLLLNEYLRKLDELERSNHELRKTRDEWDAELSRTRADIRDKKDYATTAVSEMLAREREVGASSYKCGKPLGLKRVQALISRQLDRIKDIAKFRLGYTRLRDDLARKEADLDGIMLSSPNLTKEDYARLEAEQFYYRRVLSSTDKQCVELIERRSLLAREREATSKKIAKIAREFDHCHAAIGLLRDSAKICLEEKRAWLAKLGRVKRFIDEFNDVIGQTSRAEFVAWEANIRHQHDQWMNNISGTLSKIKHLGQSLNAVRANLILHGKNFQLSNGTRNNTSHLPHSSEAK